MLKRQIQFAALVTSLAVSVPNAFAQAPASVFTYQSAELPSRIAARSGDTVAVSVAGGIQMMTRNAGVWSNETLIEPPYPTPSGGYSDFFGWSIALSGDTLVVGAPNEDSSATGVNGDQSDNSFLEAGAAYVYKRQGAVWSMEAYLKASSPHPYAGFGGDVAISGDTLIVASVEEASSATGVNGSGDSFGASSSGAAFVFERTGTTWSQTAFVKASNAEAYDRFGSAVAISGDTFVVTAAHEDNQIPGVNVFEGGNGQTEAGAAYVFTRTGGVWSQEAYIKSSSPKVKAHFGHDVAIDGDLIAISTIDEGGSATGINGPESDWTAMESGAVYGFQRSAGVWSQTAYLKASNTEAFDHFGEALAVHGNQVLVMAPGELGGAAGIDSAFQQVNGFFTPNRSGAAYLFEVDGTTWSQKHYIKGSSSLNKTEKYPWIAANNFARPGCSIQDGEFSVGPFVFNQAATAGMRRYGAATGANTMDLYILGKPSPGETLRFEVAGSPGYFNTLAFVMASAAPANLPGVFGGTLLFDLNLSLSGLSPLLLMSSTDQTGQANVPVTLPAGTVGMSVYCQAFFLSAEFQDGLEMTTGVAMTVGH